MHFRGAGGQRDSGPCELRNYNNSNNNNNDLETEYFDDNSVFVLLILNGQQLKLNLIFLL
jgi:hypothetical protein